MKLILGLGNPGRRYAQTRHNVGFRAVERLAARLGSRFVPGPEGAEGTVADVARAKIAAEDLVIARPLTWMNHSGDAASRLAARYGAEAADMIVIYDDIALELGTVRVRPEGRSGGQKGMESVIQALGTSAIPRVRLGILGDRGDRDLADYVLEPFEADERDAAETMIERGADAAVAIVTDGVPHAMNVFNRREAQSG